MSWPAELPGLVGVVYNCPKCGARKGRFEQLPTPSQWFCTGTYDRPHGRRAMDTTVYDVTLNLREANNTQIAASRKDQT